MTSVWQKVPECIQPRPRKRTAIGRDVYVDVILESTPIRLLVDGGSALSLLNLAHFTKITGRSKEDLEPPCVNVVSYTGDEIEVVGQATLSVHIGIEPISVLFLIVSNPQSISLLGSAFLTSNFAILDYRTEKMYVNGVALPFRSEV